MRKKEVWRDIEGHECFYQVSTKGRIKSLRRTLIRKNGHTQTIKERILKSSLGTSGYPTTHLANYGKYRTLMIHRLVAIAFIPNPENKPQINHIDGDKTNNNDWNLEWATQSENMRHSFDVLNQIPVWEGKFGKDNPNSIPVLQYTKDSVFIDEFYGISEAGRETGVWKSDIGSACRGKLKTAGGYIWKHKLKMI